MKTWANILLTFTRNYKPPRRWSRDAVKYGLVKYYPRQKNHQDPEVTPSKLLMVQRVKPYKGNPYWEKEVLDGFGLGEEEKLSKIAIVKNIPETCSRLWTVKHLVKITPVRLPETEINESIIDRVWLHENGRLYQSPKIDERRYEAASKYKSDRKRLEAATISEKLRLIWVKGDLPV